MEQPTIESISQEEFERAVNTYITWASEWDGSLPADVFFGVWADLQREKPLVELHARVVEGRLQLSAPPGSPIRVQGNRLYLEDGREVEISLEMAA